MCQEFKKIFLATALRAYECLKFLLTGAVEANDLAQGALRRYTQCRWIGHPQPSNWEAELYPQISPPQRNLLRQCLGVRWCYDVPLGSYCGTNDRR